VDDFWLVLILGEKLAATKLKYKNLAEKIAASS
jgi:hypothetical protein